MPTSLATTQPSAQVPLPSQDAAYRLVRGQPNGLRDSAGSTAARAVLIGVGLAVCGVRGKTLVKQSLVSAAAVEAFVLEWTFAHREDA